MEVTETALVVGGGSIGRRHTQNLRQLGLEVAVVDQAAEVRTELAAELGVRTFAKMSDGLDSEYPDIVVICTPNSSHIKPAVEAARAGCHLLIEKPLSDGMDGVDELEAVVSAQDLITLVGCNLRFHPDIKKLRGLLDGDVIGRIVAARIEFGSYLPGWFPDKDYRESYSARDDLGGGVILDCIHEINYARWLFDEFETVSALAGQRTGLDIETNDIAGILAETADGIVCEFHLDYIQREYSRSCHIIGENGTIRWSWENERVVWYVADEDTHSTYERPADWGINDMYVEEMKHFLSCVRSHEATNCSVSCGMRDLAVALAARQSAESGRHVSPNGVRQ